MIAGLSSAFGFSWSCRPRPCGRVRATGSASAFAKLGFGGLAIVLISVGRHGRGLFGGGFQPIMRAMYCDANSHMNSGDHEDDELFLISHIRTILAPERGGFVAGIGHTGGRITSLFNLELRFIPAQDRDRRKVTAGALDIQDVEHKKKRPTGCPNPREHHR